MRSRASVSGEHETYTSRRGAKRTSCERKAVPQPLRGGSMIKAASLPSKRSSSKMRSADAARKRTLVSPLATAFFRAASTALSITSTPTTDRTEWRGDAAAESAKRPEPQKASIKVSMGEGVGEPSAPPDSP